MHSGGGLAGFGRPLNVSELVSSSTPSACLRQEAAGLSLVWKGGEMNTSILSVQEEMWRKDSGNGKQGGYFLLGRDSKAGQRTQSGGEGLRSACVRPA